MTTRLVQALAIPAKRARQAQTAPTTIRTMLEQMNVGHIHGAPARMGTSQLTWKCEREGYPNPSQTTPGGFIDYEVGVRLKVNGQRFKQWYMYVTYEPSDTYTVRLWIGTLKQGGKFVNECTDVYAEDLDGIMNDMYDKAIRDFNHGFINLS